MPFDVVGHGTHVMGTITGSTAFDTVGVAPGAEWIATNAIAASIENFDNAIIAGFEWLADPDGNPDTTDDVPDVCHNSWGVVTDYGYPPCYSGWWSVIDNCEAAGVVVTFSAGNEGPAPGTLRSPGDRATTATNCFTVGSTATNFPNAVSSFSSRGPSLCGGEWAIKPEVMGPGEDIISCFPGGSYGYMSGTSMAGPHIAGVVALMRQAAPNLDVTTIKEVLMATAIDLGTVGEDNNYGHGMVDAYAAVAMVMDNVGTVQGMISDEITGLPMAGVRVQDTRGEGQTTSDEDGQYQFTIFSGPVTLQFSRWGYLDATFTVEIPAGGALDRDVVLTPMPLASISGTVYGPEGIAVEGAAISVLDNPVSPVISGPDGTYDLPLPAGSDVNYELLAVAPNLAYELQYVGHSGQQILDFHLPVPLADGFESGGFDTFDWQTGGDQPWTVGNAQAYEGALSAQTGAVSHSSSTELAIDYYVHGDGDFSFHYKVDTEISYDMVKFYIDDVLQETWSGSIDWTRYTTSLTTGMHGFRWVYTKDSEVSVGQDAAWIDLVEFPGTGEQPMASIALSDDQLSYTLDAGTTGSVMFEIGNDGGYPLEFAIQPTPAWAQVSPATGMLYPGNWQPITVSLSGSSATAGINQTTLVISSNDPDQPEANVEVTLTVNPVSAVGELPRQLSLTGAVPNPFNPSTAIKFGLPGETRVSLDVYDVSGRPRTPPVESNHGRGITPSAGTARTTPVITWLRACTSPASRQMKKPGSSPWSWFASRIQPTGRNKRCSESSRKTWCSPCSCWPWPEPVSPRKNPG